MHISKFYKHKKCNTSLITGGKESQWLMLILWGEPSLYEEDDVFLLVLVVLYSCGHFLSQWLMLKPQRLKLLNQWSRLVAMLWEGKMLVANWRVYALPKGDSWLSASTHVSCRKISLVPPHHSRFKDNPEICIFWCENSLFCICFVAESLLQNKTK